MSITRMGSANMYDRTINNLTKQQKELADQMERVSAGRRVIRPSDDPVAAAQAERASTRLDRAETDKRMLQAQTATITYGETTLGEINEAVQELRTLLVQAGNGAYNQAQRDTLEEQLTSLRAQVLKYANRSDSNGLPLFRGLDTQAFDPFPNGQEGVQSGQTSSSEYTITNSLDGVLAFFSARTGNGVLAVDANPGNQGQAHANAGVIKDPATATALTAPVDIVFHDDNGVLSYSVDGGPLMPYKEGDAIDVAGMALTINGKPEPGDSFTVKPSETISVFDVMDRAIDTVRNGGNPDGSTNFGALSHGISQSLAELDTALNRISTVRGVAGDLINQAKRMETTILSREELMADQYVSALGSTPEEQVAAAAKMNEQQTVVSVALQSYASIQKLSLFDYIR